MGQVFNLPNALDGRLKTCPTNCVTSDGQNLIWKSLIRPVLFSLPAEPIHYASMNIFSGISALPLARSMFSSQYVVKDSRLQQQLFGLDFENPVGLAAGFDKNARWIPQLASLGFGHVEVGTITGQQQSGNPKPRLFRLPADKALLNRMGFNNDGSQLAAERLEALEKKGRPENCCLGINIGKTKVVPLCLLYTSDAADE